MKLTIVFLITLLITSCNNAAKQNRLPIIGTWQLVSATSTENKNTVSTFNPSHNMIKIINPTHFAFLNHSLPAEKDSSFFDAGGGTYTLSDDSIYTEHLEYYADKQWENNSFRFVIHIHNDTLVQKGIEKVDKLGIDHIIIETYQRIK